MNKKLAVIVVLAGVLLSSACAANSAQRPLKIIFSSPYEVPFGEAIRNAAQLALDEIDGKVGDIPVELVFVDGGVTENKELTALALAENDPQVVAFVGAYISGYAREVIPAANALRLAVISPSATWPGLTKTGYGIGEPGMYYPNGERMFFRVVPSDDIQGQVAAQWLSGRNYTSVYIVGQENPYSAGLTNLLLSNAEDVGVAVVGNSNFDDINISADDIAALVESINAANPDAVYFPVEYADTENSQTGALLNAIHESAPLRPIIGGDALLISGNLPVRYPRLSNVYATTLQIDLEQPPAMADFVSRYEAAYQTELSASDYPLLMSYEAVKTVFDAIARAGQTPTRASVLQALRETQNYNGILGQWSFDENGDTSFSSYGILTVEDGEWVSQ
ncbi:MAG: branched-chain amino acid ABC transporter substrate-binding protein [Phototrophicaceae bacterium]|jgi:branched-chain amino acid transport system substrate-binding protein